MSNIAKLTPSEVAYLKAKLPDYRLQTAAEKTQFVQQCAKHIVGLRQEDVDHPYILACLQIVSDTTFSAGARFRYRALTELRRKCEAGSPIIPSIARRGSL